MTIEFFWRKQKKTGLHYSKSGTAESLLFALVLTESNFLEQNKRVLNYEQLNTPFALSSLVLNAEISCNRFHDFHFS